MVQIHRLSISPPLINTSCAWAGEADELRALFNSPYTGAVTIRTATLDGFREDSTHTVAFLSASVSSINSYGYSPHPLSTYIEWIRDFIRSSPESSKPFIFSITSSDPTRLQNMVDVIQSFREEIGDMTETKTARIGIELNTSCPNIRGRPPPSYDFPSLIPLLAVLAKSYQRDSTLTIGLKLPPYVYATQFTDVVTHLSSFSKEGNNPFSFITCVNTLGSNLLFSEQTLEPTSTGFALPTPLGGLAGEAIHSLALGNVYAFFQLLKEHQDPAVRGISIIGAGGVTTPDAVQRMRAAGAHVVGVATLLGREGVDAFKKLSGDA